ncbi:MAG: 16S rRNA (uracil(1498)-N(3))-methyltransferase [Syntrophomonadales bacterium]
MRRFFVAPDNILGMQVFIDGDEARHIAVVLRSQPGDEIIVFDGSEYEYEVRLLSVTSSMVTGQVLSSRLTTADPPIAITLVQGLAKGEKMDYIIQKSVELGANRIIPVQTDHSVVKLDRERALGKVKRWNRMTLEACKQCGRNQPPVVEEVSRLDAVLKRVSGMMPSIFFYEQCKTNKLGALLNQHRQEMLEQGVAVFIGPEGGFSQSEAQLAEKSGALMAGLGPRTLRTETAGLAALTILMWELGDLGGNR